MGSSLRLLCKNSSALGCPLCFPPGWVRLCLSGAGCDVLLLPPPFLAEDRAAQSLLNKLIRSNLVDTTNQVEVLQRDPTSPLYSVKSFEELRL